VVPVLFIYAIALLYIIVIFELFDAVDSVTGKLVVTGAAFCFKVGGNKVMLKLIQGYPPWIIDSMLFNYEFLTALLLRVLQLSLPDQQTAQLVGLIGAISEVCVRVFFFNLYLKAGIHNHHQGATLEDMLRYAKWGKLRVQDGSNDMVVEYLSSIVASMFILMILPLDAFSFTISGEIETRHVLILCAYQIVPELFLDFYVTFMECFCGLEKLHIVCWDSGFGGDLDSNSISEKMGDLPKGLCAKLLVLVIQMVFVLGVMVK
jgi:hypothetical protein